MLPATHCQSVALCGYLNLTLPSVSNSAWIPSSGKKLSNPMNQDSSLLFPHWIKPAGSLLIPSLHGSTSVNPVLPPPPIAPTTETLGPSIILAHQCSLSPVPRVNNLLVSPPPSVGVPVPVSYTFQHTVNKLLTVKTLSPELLSAWSAVKYNKKVTGEMVPISRGHWAGVVDNSPVNNRATQRNT
ncbi:hypothetical protein ILYODFUR_032109, partial [Ilyodon furcidens]